MFTCIKFIESKRALCPSKLFKQNCYLKKVTQCTLRCVLIRNFFFHPVNDRKMPNVIRSTVQWAAGEACESSRPACVVYLPLPGLLDISLSFRPSLHLPNVTLSTSTLSQLKCFYSPSCLVWHECAAEHTVDRTLQEGEQRFMKLAVCHMWRLWARTEQTLSWCSQCGTLCEYWWLSLNHLYVTVFLSGCEIQRKLNIQACVSEFV